MGGVLKCKSSVTIQAVTVEALLVRTPFWASGRWLAFADLRVQASANTRREVPGRAVSIGLNKSKRLRLQE